MNWFLIALTLLAAQPKDAERARNQSNRRSKAESKAVLVPSLPGAGSTVLIPVTGTGIDSVGRKYTFSGTVTLEVIDPPPPPPPPPPPVGITFSGVTDSFGTPLMGASAGKVLKLKGTGFPMSAPSSFLRLALAGKSMIVSAWTTTTVEWAIPNTATDPLTTPITGQFEVWRQTNGTWELLGKGGSFTLLPPGP